MLNFDKIKGNSSEDTKKETYAQESAEAESYSAVETSMPSSSDNGNSGNVLSKSVSINGKINLKGDIAIDGNIDGEINTKGVVTINQNAVINATIKAGTIVVHGKINGNLDAAERIEILRTAEVRGDIRAALLKVEAGAVFVGGSEIGDHKKSSNSSSKPSKSEKKAEVKQALSSSEE